MAQNLRQWADATATFGSEGDESGCDERPDAHTPPKH
jgi:hypothetical protein